MVKLFNSVNEVLRRRFNLFSVAGARGLPPFSEELIGATRVGCDLTPVEASMFAGEGGGQDDGSEISGLVEAVGSDSVSAELIKRLGKVEGRAPSETEWGVLRVWGFEVEWVISVPGLERMV